MRYFTEKFLPFFALQCLWVFPAAGQSNYTITDLGGLSGGKFANATSINDSGQIVGISEKHSFLWQNGVMLDLGTLGGNSSAANAINDHGEVAGESETPSGEMHAFLWAHGLMVDLGTSGETSSAQGLNNLGQIVGAASGKNIRGGAAIWRNGRKQSLGDLGPTGSGSTAIAINDSDVAIGVCSGLAPKVGGVVRAVLWRGGVIEDIGTLGGPHSTATAINNRGDVVGWAEVADRSTHAFLWQDGVMHSLNILPGGVVKPGSGSQAAAVNARGQVVGSSLNARGETRAVIWEDSKILDLNDLTSAPTGVVFTRATGINNRGQIVVVQQTRPDGPTRSFLLTPEQAHNQN